LPLLEIWLAAARESEVATLARRYCTRSIQPTISKMVEVLSGPLGGRVSIPDEPEALLAMASADINVDVGTVCKVLGKLPDLTILLKQVRFTSVYSKLAVSVAQGLHMMIATERKERKLSDELANKFITYRMHVKEFKKFMAAEGVPAFKALRKTGEIQFADNASSMNVKFEATKQQIHAVLDKAAKYGDKVGYISWKCHFRKPIVKIPSPPPIKILIN
jgi:hypothetical protein